MAEFYEFFAGGGMARAGLGPNWKCSFANDFDPKKAASYAANWGAEHLLVGDIANVTLADLPGRADLAWASFPCQDLSLAGARSGLQGKRSGTFWPFWELMQGLVASQRGPQMIVLENVYGLLTSAGGKDFNELCKAIARLGYRVGAMLMDAVHFVPQSRPRLFIVAVADGAVLPESVVRSDPNSLWHPRGLIEAKFRLPKSVEERWLWWNVPPPPLRECVFADVIEDEPSGVAWHTADETRALLAMMAPVHQQKVKIARQSGEKRIGALYRRTRNGVQRAEVRFDDVAGCLRTPGGGSSRQSILVVEGRRVRSRLLSAREAARLMGLPDGYALPEKYNEAYHLMGDGLAVPVVAHLGRHVLDPVVAAQHAPAEQKAVA